MSRHDPPKILNIAGAFNIRGRQIPQHPHDRAQYSQNQQEPNTNGAAVFYHQALPDQSGNQETDHPGDNAANGPFHCFMGADHRRQLMLAEKAADKVGADIRRPCAQQH